MKTLLYLLRVTGLLVAALCFSVVGSVLLMPQVLRAQFSAQSTFVPASAVSYSSGSNTYSFALSNVASIADLVGVPIRFIPPSASTNAAGGTNLNPSSFGAQAIKRVSAGSLVAVAGGDLSSGVLAEVIWDASEFVLKNPATGDAPVGSEISVTGPNAPAGYLIENGTCVSQTTYAALYAFYGSTDIWSPGSTGGACSAGQFHLPYANGSAAVAYDQQGAVTAGKLTSAGSGCAATSVAVNCGAQNRTIAQTNFPATLTGTSVSGGSGGINALDTFAQTGGGNSGIVYTGTGGGVNAPNVPFGGISFSNATFNTGGSGTALPTVQPTYTVIKAVKY